MTSANGIIRKIAADSPALNLAAPWPMPQWLPDETFFSLASRYHAISGNRLAEHTNLALFGLRRSGSKHDFPTYLGEFAQRTGKRLGSAETIVSNHTILPFYLPARSKEDATAALESLTGPPNGMLKYRLGMVTSRFRANHPLKACPSCMAEDVSKHGIAYWHRAHQLPGAWVCGRHCTGLHEATLKSTGVQRFGWLLPDAGILRPVMANSASLALIDDLRRFATLVDKWNQLRPGNIQVEHLGAVYRSALAGQGLTKSRPGIARDYCQAISQLRAVPELAALPATPQAALHQVNRWVFAPQGNTHPLRHLSFIFWLFRDWRSFWSAYVRQPAIGTGDGATDPVGTSPAADSRRAALVGLIRAGTAATAAAKAVGIDTGTAIAWAAAEGISTGRRPKTLKDETYLALITDLKSGTSKAVAAARHGVSLQSVTRVLRSEVGLRNAWDYARWSNARSQARSKWQHALQAFSTDGVAAPGVTNRRLTPGSTETIGVGWSQLVPTSIGHRVAKAHNAWTGTAGMADWPAMFAELRQRWPRAARSRR